ncbi:hypothetical protein N7453_011668 [Penicillium expansum]|nr:hypothetical protein N7453_011668 [Penicillium expansum]
MTQKLIVIVGATGGQGGSVVSTFLRAGGWRIRGLTRNPESDKAKALAAQGVEMVKADIGDMASLEIAFHGAHVIFAITDYYENFWMKGWERSMEIEYTHGTNMAKAASKVSTLEHYLWSTLPHSTRVSEGLALVPHFEAKGRVDEFIREDKALLERTTFCFFTTFVINLTEYEVFKPIYLAAAKRWIQIYPADPDSAYPSLGDHRVNTGIFVHSLVNNRPPGGTYVRCSVEDLTLESFLALWGRASGVAPGSGSTKVIQVSPETYIDLYGHMGEEQARQWEFSRILKETGALNRYGIHVQEAQEFMSKDAIASLVSPEQSLRNIDWKAHGY